ncbi:CdaR family transcriptional regulator [Dietzia sp. ANT_WB102]|uniref:PucR family transcriptional regulator n=1 Tax=Dietzia sp. ANT_WB102 TaxID=2597345 RepID=UPI0011F03D5E|nr:helix-turn-helix domain-containing protein [Dietzia sp. ANT_WB102]KAA0917196.1 PucR family transcriptional regulator [Dietzia sp. ANT_WB102]
MTDNPAPGVGEKDAQPLRRRSATPPEQRPVSDALLKRITRYSGTLSTEAVRALEQELPFFAELSADQRAEIQLIIQSAVRDFVTWMRNPEAPHTDTIAGFKLLPKGLGQGLTLQQTVQLVRSTLEYFELVMPRISHNERQRGLMIAAVLKFGRELGFTAASVYAAAAENRGAWDTRMEAMIVDAVVRGDRHADLTSGASALNWDPTTAATVIVGSPREDLGLASVPAVHRAAVAAGRHALAVVQGARLVVILSGELESSASIPPGVLDAFSSDSPVVHGHTVRSLVEAPDSASEALSGATAVNGWPGAPRPVAAIDLLPERVLGGDRSAAAMLVDRIVTPLRGADVSVEDTLRAYLDSGGHVEACARELYVHPNTVRYRLKRVSQITKFDPLNARDAFVLRIALVLGKFAEQSTQES